MLENEEPIKIILITGYLGAGKTTLLNNVLANKLGMRAAVIVNDIGDVNIDAELIAKNGSKLDETVIPLTNGCICCSLSEDLAEQLENIAVSNDFDYIVIEASGICEPMPIAYTISEYCTDVEDSNGMFLDNIVTVIDCGRMLDEFDAGRSLLEGSIDNEDIRHLLIDQIEFCTTIVLNKTDLVTPAQLDEVRHVVRSLQTEAIILEAVNGEVPLEQVFDTGRFDFDRVYQSAAWLDMMINPKAHENHESDEELEYGISTFVYERRRPFDLDKFGVFAKAWPTSIIRTKGLVWLDEQPDRCFILEQAGNQRSFVDNGLFISALPHDEQEKMLEEHPGILNRWDDECGDRMIKLVFIGRNMDQRAIEGALDDCLTEWARP